MSDTMLVISGPGLTPYSARGLTQTLEYIEAAVKLRRTINGTLLDVSSLQFRKYLSTVNCTDQNAPAIEGLRPGLLVTVDCVVELSYKTEGGGPSRTVVPGSERTEGAFTFYRPRLQMRVKSISTSTDEWAAIVQWSLDLEEV